MVTYHRRVRLEEIDVAQIVFFARYYAYANEAMELLCEELDGTYVGYITQRKLCFATVKMACEFSASLHYGDTVDIAVTVARLGTKSATLVYHLTRGDGVASAVITHTVVSFDIAAGASCAMPQDARAMFERHLVSGFDARTD